jgi:2'-5' RNA ligase
MCQNDTPTTLAQHYDRLWRSAVAAFEGRHVQLDPHLPHKQGDARRGYTLMIRPAPPVTRRIAAFLAEFDACEPGQYLYRPVEFHVTLLSLFTATEGYQPYFERRDAYIGAVDRALGAASRFAIHFRGVTASPGAVMIQGFPQDETFARLRDAVRRQLHLAGLGEGLDQRYRIRAAHATVIRFQRPPHDLPGLLHFLSQNRERDFGTSPVSVIQFVENDWYMSEDRVKVVKEYALQAGSSG